MLKIKVRVENKCIRFLDIAQGTYVDVVTRSNKFFHNDVIYVKNTEHIIHESPVRDSFLAGVLVVVKTYGRASGRLLYKCIPDNVLLPSFLVPYDMPATFQKNHKNKYIVFRFDHWDDDHPRGEMKQTLGDVDSVEAFEEYQLWRRNLHISISSFANITRQQIRKTGSDESIYVENILEKNDKKHEDHRTIEDYRTIEDHRTIGNVFTIDPEGCTDFDDAFSVIFEDRFATINVYIANVYLWLETYDLWEFVSERVSTIYLPDRKVPMLPPLLSDTLCSLKQGHDRFAFMMSLKYDMTTKQHVGEPVYKNVLIRINKNYVYEDTKGLDRNPAYRVLRELAQSNDIIDSHEVVSFWMIKMNSECAKYLSKMGKGIFRGKSEATISEATISESVASKKVPSYLFEKCAITYEKEAIPHPQLGLDAYVHITSPIRRLVDILNQILFQKDVSTGCQTFFDKWFDNLDQINRATKDIRRVQMDCELLALCTRDTNLVNREFVGIIFDKDDNNSYMVYIEQLKLVSRVNTHETIPNGSQIRLKIYMFHDEHKLCKKVKLSILHAASK